DLRERSKRSCPKLGLLRRATSTSCASHSSPANDAVNGPTRPSSARSSIAVLRTYTSPDRTLLDAICDFRILLRRLYEFLAWWPTSEKRVSTNNLFRCCIAAPQRLNRMRTSWSAPVSNLWRLRKQFAAICVRSSPSDRYTT